MSPTAALWIAGTLLVVSVAAGVVFRLLDGRRQGGGHLRFDPQHATTALGERVTLVQFSTEICTRCPQVRRMLSALAANHDGLAHVEVDLTHRADLAARYRVLQTPTTFVVDRSGAVRARFNGVPHRHALSEAIAAV